MRPDHNEILKQIQENLNCDRQTAKLRLLPTMYGTSYKEHKALNVSIQKQHAEELEKQFYRDAPKFKRLFHIIQDSWEIK